MQNDKIRITQEGDHVFATVPGIPLSGSGPNVNEAIRALANGLADFVVGRDGHLEEIRGKLRAILYPPLPGQECAGDRNLKERVEAVGIGNGKSHEPFDPRVTIIFPPST